MPKIIFPKREKAYTVAMTDESWNSFCRRRSRSPFRMRFHLSASDREYIAAKGMETIERHAKDFVIKRLSPARIANDGKQTPMRGHPVFIAQHATGCCCRSCLMKWHSIPPGRALSDEEVDYVVEILMRWIEDEMKVES